MITTTLTVNDRVHAVTAEATATVLDVLRDHLGLTGAKRGCNYGVCGTCSVLIDGKRTFSCSTAIADLEGKSITTIEGLATNGKLHPLQQAFIDEGAFQCAYCTSGMIMQGVALLSRKPSPTEAEIADAMNGNICRCCVQPQIIQAIKKAWGTDRRLVANGKKRPAQKVTPAKRKAA